VETAKARRRPMAEINVVPYIDVMLVLLVIFMITAPLLNLGVEVELPKADAEPMEVGRREPLVSPRCRTAICAERWRRRDAAAV
jgi:biopolymer transport protein TolR